MTRTCVKIGQARMRSERERCSRSFSSEPQISYNQASRIRKQSEPSGKPSLQLVAAQVAKKDNLGVKEAARRTENLSLGKVGRLPSLISRESQQKQSGRPQEPLLVCVYQEVEATEL